jgi:hypothetical protein
MSFRHPQAGIPKTIPAVLDKMVAGLAVDMRLDVKGAMPDDELCARLDPAALMGGSVPALTRPTFLAIVSSHVLAGGTSGDASSGGYPLDLDSKTLTPLFETSAVEGDGRGRRVSRGPRREPSCWCCGSTRSWCGTKPVSRLASSR